MRLAVLPARGGSKRIPRKNIREFCGKPIIAWPIAAAIESGAFDAVIVSTDAPEIAETALAHGAQVPFIRPADLSDDSTPTTPVIAHATQWALDRGWAVSEVCCLYPTAPMVVPTDIVDGLRTLIDGGWDFVLTATDYAAVIFRAFRKAESGGMEMFFPEHFSTRSQDLPRALHDAGQFYWGRTDAWLSGRPLFGQRSAPLLIPRWRVQDIDTPDDWQRGEALFKALQRDMGRCRRIC
jgi:N-acylneuraminate cytidylyltransferase